MNHKDSWGNDQSSHERRECALDRPERVLAFLELAETYWQARNSETQRECLKRLEP